MPETLSTIAEIQSHAAAQRYALALSTAAAAQERISALEEALKDAEWLRLQAESLAATVTYADEFATVWHMGTEPPPEGVDGLIDLASGTPWQRVTPTLWRKLATGASSTRHEWPIDDAGPFIAMPSAYGIRELGRTLDAVIADHDGVRRQIYGRNGYSEEGARSWDRPTLRDAVSRVLATDDRERAALRDEVFQLKSKLAEAGVEA